MDYYLFREQEQGVVLDKINDANAEFSSKTHEFNNLKGEISVMEVKNQQERKQVEILNQELREATGLSNKNYAEIVRCKDSLKSRDVENRNLYQKIELMEVEVEQNKSRII